MVTNWKSWLVGLLFAALPAQAIYLTTTDSMEVITSAAVNLDYTVSYSDITTTTFSPANNTGQTTTATTTAFLAAPAASTQRKITRMSFYNADASTANTLTIQMDVSGANRVMIKLTLAAGESLEWTPRSGWQHYYTWGAPYETSGSGATDLQVFTASGAGTWTKPTWFTPHFVRVVMWGGGGGGGGGGSSATTKCGGAGGGGAAYAEWIFLASDLTSTESVNVGAAGSSGAGGASASDGSDGGAGGDSSFGSSGTNSITTWIKAYGGGGGRRGTATLIAGAGGGGGGTGGAGGVGLAATAGPGGFPGPVGVKGVSGVVSGTGSDGVLTNSTSHNAEFGGGGGGGRTAVPVHVAGGPSI
jgi:hypothetical protein